MSSQGFDTWVLEVRGAGLSVRASTPKDIVQSANAVSKQMEDTAKGKNIGVLSGLQQSAADDCTGIGNAKDAVDDGNSEPLILVTAWDESKLVSRLTEMFMQLSERLSGFLSDGQSKIMSAKFFDQISQLLEDSQLLEGFNEIRNNFSSLLEVRQNSGIANQIRDLSQRLVNIFEESQNSVSPSLFNLQERFSSTIEDFQKQLDLIVKYDWDFDHYLEEDVPAAVR